MFETSLVDAHLSRRTSRFLVTSAGLHFALAATLVSAAYWHIGPVAEPVENAIWHVQLAPPTPPAGGSPKRAETLAAKPAEAKAEIVQPKEREIANEIPEAADTVEPVEPRGSGPVVLTLGPTSDGPATPGGPGIGDGPNHGFEAPGHGSEIPGPAVVNDQPYRLGGAIVKPVLIRRVEPVYSELARRAHVSGTVILQTVIDESGRVIDIKVVKGMPFGLETAAISAVSQWRFKPATLNGRAVKVFFNLTIQFSLS